MSMILLFYKLYYSYIVGFNFLAYFCQISFLICLGQCDFKLSYCDILIKYCEKFYFLILKKNDKLKYLNTIIQSLARQNRLSLNL